jgi:hypothetical protein
MGCMSATAFEADFVGPRQGVLKKKMLAHEDEACARRCPFSQQNDLMVKRKVNKLF